MLPRVDTAEMLARPSNVRCAYLSFALRSTLTLAPERKMMYLQRMESLPKRLESSPLVEVIFEMRFSAQMLSAGDILPGLLYNELKGRYPTVQSLPVANVPRNIRDKDPNLLYQPSHRLASEDAKQAIQVGDRVVSLTSSSYPGWSVFLNDIVSMLTAVKNTNLINEVERFSFRYINLLNQAELSGMSLHDILNIKIELLGQSPIERGLYLRMERDSSEFITVIQIIANAVLQIGYVNPTQTSGPILDIDTMRKNLSLNFLQSPVEMLTEAHLIVKETFFGVLQVSARERLRPEV